MNKFIILLGGEIKRLIHYRIAFFGILTSLIWVLVIALSSATEAQGIFPLVVAMDAGPMAVILLGASYYYEKQEGSTRSLLVSPISDHILIGAKIASSVLLSLVSTVFTAASAFIFHGIVVNYGLLILWVALTVFAHIAAGYLLILISPDFMSMLLRYSGILLLLCTPSVLNAFDLMPGFWGYLGFLSPFYAGQWLVASLFNAGDLGHLLAAAISLAIIGGGCFVWLVPPLYRRRVMEG